MNHRIFRFFGAYLVSIIISTSAHKYCDASEGDASSRDEIYATDHLLDIRIKVAPKDWDQLRHQTRSLIGSLAEDRDWESPFEYVPATSPSMVG